MLSYPNAHLLVTPAALAAELGLGSAENAQRPAPSAKAPLLLDLRPAEDFARGLLPGAVHLDLWGLSLKDTDPAPLDAFVWMIVHVLEMRGVNADVPVVVYDEKSGMRAARAFWFLEYLGHPSVRMLDGGFGAWMNAGLPVATFIDEASRGAERGEGVPALRQAQGALRFSKSASDAPGGVQAPSPGFDDPGRSSKSGVRGVPPQERTKVEWAGGEPPRVDARVATWRDVRDRLGRADVAMLDTRSRGEYCGTIVRAKRAGAIPGAVHIEWTDNLGPDGAFKPADELRLMYEAAGVTPDREVVTYCQGGYRAAHSYVALRLLGYPRVRNYIGSWKEWGDRGDLPIEVPGA